MANRSPTPKVQKPSSKTRARSSELTGGAGFTYEDAVIALFLTGLIREEAAVGSIGSIVRVAVQQASQGEPMDDLVVDSLSDGQIYRQGLQVKSSLTISKSDGDFQEIIRQALETREKPDFSQAHHKYGFIVSSVGNDRFQSLRRIITRARSSTTGAEFVDRFLPGREASAQDIALKAEILGMLGNLLPNEEMHFYQAFVAQKLDGLDEGGDRFSDLSNKLGEICVDGGAQGVLLAKALCRHVREGEGAARVWTRATLITVLKGLARLKVAPAYVSDMSILADSARSAVREIRTDIGGIEIERPTLLAKAEECASTYRFSDLRGLPGAGKSVVLRKLVEKSLERGPTLFLKSDRLEGNSWRSFANSLNLQHLDPKPLLAEIGAIGTPILFIDGIDRIKPDQRKIVTDLVLALEEDPALSNWTILATSRDQGLEVLRSWIPFSLHKTTGAGSVDVGALDDDEAGELATALPALRPLLFGIDAVREIARRPFFASVLAKRASSGAPAQTPQSETQLIAGWWEAGGYDVPSVEAISRQRAMLLLAEVGAPTLGKSISLRSAREAMSEIPSLTKDRIFEVTEAGSFGKFTHDIYFEWAFFRLLIDRGEEWPQAIIEAGEAPLLARVVGLLSQHVFERDENWPDELSKLDPTHMRPQWRRAWLIGPAASPAFWEKQSVFKKPLVANDHELLLRFLTWFQAERTIPNPNILGSTGSDVSADIRMQVADRLGWPSDLALWQRVLAWIFANQESFPPAALPTVISIFAAWQHMFAAIANPYSERILLSAIARLNNLDGEEASQHIRRRDASNETIKSLRDLVLSSAVGYPEMAGQIIDSLITKPDREEPLNDVLRNAVALSRGCPEKLAEIVLHKVREDLPKARREKQRLEREAQLEAAKARRARRESDGSDEFDDEYAFDPFFTIGYNNDLQRDGYSLKEHDHSFHPAGAGSEPFASLFENAPDVGRTLVRDLANHATQSWQEDTQLHPEQCGTPIPIDIEFPWGTQKFWGDERTYFWFCGDWAPDVLASALLALSLWAHKQLDSGRNVDSVIKEVVEGHTSWTVLGLAVALTLQSEHVTPVTTSLASNQLLWHMDIRRVGQEPTRGINLLGFDPAEQMSWRQREATKYLQSRSYRSSTLKNMSFRFALSEDETLRSRFQRAVGAFPENLPFLIEEEREDPNAVARLKETANLWAGLGNAENYELYRVEDKPEFVAIEYKEPSPPTLDVIEKRSENEIVQREYAQLGWANKALESQTPPAPATLQKAIDFAISRDDKALFDAVAEPGTGVRQAMVSLTATVTLQFSTDEKVVKWAWAVMDRISNIQDLDETYRRSNNSNDPRIALVIALCRDLLKAAARKDSSARLLSLTCSNTPFISTQAFRALFAIPDHPSLSWNAAILALDLSHYIVPTHGTRSRASLQKSLKLRREALKRAFSRIEKKAFTPLNPPPPAWVKRKSNSFPGIGPATKTETWDRPEIDFDARLAGELLRQFPVNDWLSDLNRRQNILEVFEAFVTWTAERLHPSWADRRDNDRRSANLWEWINGLGRAVARVAPAVVPNQFYTRFINALANYDERDDLKYFSKVVDLTTRMHVYDSKDMSSNVVEILQIAADRIAGLSTFRQGGYRAGEISDQVTADLVESIFLISATDCSGAVRFANGDWKDLPIMLPVIESFVEKVGWADGVMSRFLTLCRRADGVMPVETFIRLINASIQIPSFREEKWIAADIPAKISGVIQQLADTNYPLTAKHSQALLTILDRLVDMGDRRAAALQQSEHFRSVQILARV